MRIADIELFTLHYPYPPGRGFAYAGGSATGRVTSLVKVTDDTGLEGWGSAYTHPGIVRATVIDHLRPHLVGIEFTAPREVWHRMHRLTRWYGRAGGAVSALGAIDTAVWDLAAQEAGQPLWRFLGGETPTVPAYASGLLWSDDVALLRDEVARHREEGFTRVKMRLGRSDDYDRKAVAAVAEAMGEAGDVLVDGSLAYSEEQAETIGGLLDELGVFWFEEPFHPSAADRFRRLRERIRTPLAAGENETGIDGFLRLLEHDALDILQPDASRVGGVSAVQEVARLASEAGKRIGTHTWSDALAVVANAHVVAANVSGLTVEIDRTGSPFVDELLGRPLIVSGGLLDLGEKPGLGVSPDPEQLEKWSVSRWPVEGNYSDMAFGAPYAPADRRYGDD